MKLYKLKAFEEWLSWMKKNSKFYLNNKNNGKDKQYFTPSYRASK